MRRTFLAGSCLAVLLLLFGAVNPAKAGDGLQPWEEDPRYWQYKGEPVLLLGGTKDDSLFQIPDLEEHLDKLAAVGGNYVRNTMSDRRDHGFEVYPFKRLAEQRDVIVQIELWDRFDYSQQNWKPHPYNPANNVNYTREASGLAHRYPAPAWKGRQPFFHTIPGMKRYKPRYDVIRKYQRRFVEKLLSHSLDYPNVLYCMNNETDTPAAWGRHWMRLIRERAEQRGSQADVTDMFDHFYEPRRCGRCRAALDRPELYTFLDISQINSRNFDQRLWKRLQWVVKRIAEHPRPINHVKVYGSGQTSWGSGTPADGVERFWRALLAGSAGVRFHRDGAGNGLKPIVQASIRAARRVHNAVPFWAVEPAMGLLSDREEDEAYAAAAPGRRYLVYFTDGGAVKLDLRNHVGHFTLRWMGIDQGQWTDSRKVTGGEAVVRLKAPGEGGWAAVLIREAG